MSEPLTVEQLKSIPDGTLLLVHWSGGRQAHPYTLMRIGLGESPYAVLDWNLQNTVLPNVATYLNFLGPAPMNEVFVVEGPCLVDPAAYVEEATAKARRWREEETAFLDSLP